METTTVSLHSQDLFSDEPDYINIDPEFHSFCAKDHSILLIDDDGDQLMLFESFLKKEGYKVFSSSNARNALGMMAKVYFDVVISDLRMPEMTGFHLIEEIRAIKTYPHTARIPVILLTNCSSDLELPALEVGADMFCEKRLARTSLTKQIKFLLV